MSLVLRDLRASYDGREVLRGVDLAVESGEIVVVTGRNGAGKTTLLHAIAGLVPATAATMTLANRSLAGLTPEARFAFGVTLAPQGHRVFASLTVGENLRLCARERGNDPWTIADMRARIPRIDERFDQRAGTLSGGETQLLLVARALVGNGSLVLLDEPSEGLDPQSLALLGSLVIEAGRRGTCMLVSEQKSDYLVLAHARRFALEDGRARAVTARSVAQPRESPARSKCPNPLDILENP